MNVQDNNNNGTEEIFYGTTETYDKGHERWFRNLRILNGLRKGDLIQLLHHRDEWQGHALVLSTVHKEEGNSEDDFVDVLFREQELKLRLWRRMKCMTIGRPLRGTGDDTSPWTSVHLGPVTRI